MIRTSTQGRLNTTELRVAEHNDWRFWQFHGSFLELSWNCPYLAPTGLSLGAGVAGEVVALTCTFGRQAFEPIAPEFITCTTSALLVERICRMSHDAARVA